MPLSEYERGDDQTSAEPLLEQTATGTPSPSLCKRYVVATIAAVMLMVVSFFLWALRGKTECSNSDGVCRQPAVRREWRALGSLERLEYLRAVKCLSSIPSTVCNGTLHDEFAYIHRKIGGYCTYRHLLL